MGTGVIAELRSGIKEADGLARRAMADIDKHEEICALRYEHINATMAGMSSDIGHIKEAIQKRDDRDRAAVVDLNWRAWVLAGAIFMIMLGGMCWMGSQLYTIHSEAAKVAHK